MICKKCGAYNPDHATFCKVCAANLKDQTDTNEAVQADEAEEVATGELRPRRGNVQAPDFSVRRSESFKAVPKDELPKEDEEALDTEEQEEEPAKASPFARAAAPVQKRRIVDEADEDEDDGAEDEYDDEEEEKPARKPLFSRSAATSKKRHDASDESDEDEDGAEDLEDEDDSDAEKLESEPETTRFARPVGKKRSVEEDDEDDDEDEDEDDDYDDEDDEDEDDEDEYEEYEPTPPRRKKSSSGKKGGDFNVVALLIVCLLVILLLIVGIVAFCNFKGGDLKSKLPSFLQFNCGGQAITEPVTRQDTVDATDEPFSVAEPTDAPVTGNQVDYNATTLEETVDDKGQPSISISFMTRPGDTVTIVLPNQDDFVFSNNQEMDQPYALTIPKSCYYPHTVLTESVYTVTPEILVTHADGTEDSLYVDSFDLTFPTVQLTLNEPDLTAIPEGGLMANENNQVVIKGTVDDHTVSVTINDQPVTSIYQGGTFEYVYTLGDEAETITIDASKSDYVPTSLSFDVVPYVFIPEVMPLSVDGNVTNHMADKNNKVTITGITAPSATLTATPNAAAQNSVLCGTPTVDAEGKYSFDVTFDKNYYGTAVITVHAKKDGYEEGETTCIVARMYADRKAAINGYNKTGSYHEVPAKYTFAQVMENPMDSGLFRFEGQVQSIDPETGIVTFMAKTSNKETIAIYVLNAVAKWDPNKNMTKACKLYCTLNGLYDDGTSLYVTAWFLV